MFRPERLLRTKLAPPRLHRRVMARPALLTRLREAQDYALTLVQAGAGYGKTTALAALGAPAAPPDDWHIPCAWYSLDESDVDPQQFLSYLIAAFRQAWPDLSDAPQAYLQEMSGASQGPYSQVIDALVNALTDRLQEPGLIILDDYHFVSPSPEIQSLVDRFITYHPPDLHIVLAGRYPFTFPGLINWRAKSQVLEIGRRDLVFQPDEIRALFENTYGIQIGPDEVAVLADKTEGWPIALQLVWQGLRNTPGSSLADLLDAGRAASSLSALFDYLARDVVDRLPADVIEFLRSTAILRGLTPAACDAVTASSGGGAMLDRLHDLDLFIVAVGERHYRYHHLFHDFLREQAALDPAGTRERHLRAASHFAPTHPEEAIYHWLSARAFAEAAQAIEAAGEACLTDGRLDTLAVWIDALPPEELATHPRLQAYLGDICRLRSRFDEALGWYAEAEKTWRARNDVAGVSHALYGQALVYLDTVRPAQAEHLLQDALRLIDGLDDREARARLLDLVAENKLNMGKPDEAEALRGQARALREEGPGEDLLSLRVKLRTGRLDEAQQILINWAEAERDEAEHGQVHPPRAHRETVLLLSLIHSFRGEADRAFALAQEGIALGELLGSPFVTAVGHMRMGHAWQLQRERSGEPIAGGHDQAIRYYQNAIALGDRLAVRRTRAEAMWGLTRAYGFAGDLASARQAAAEGIEIAQWAGDPWLTALIELTLSASCVLAGQAQDGLDILLRSLVALRDAGDSFGRAAARLWLALAYHQLRQPERLSACLDELLALCEAHSYDFLFTLPTLLGPPDPRRTVPLLIEARNRRYRPAYASRLLAQMGLPEIQVHPGYQLRVKVLGTFRVWRGQVEMAPREWQRDKARQLFQLLLTERGHWLQRDEIVERLWPDLGREAAGRDFKVALNALNRAIEPAHLPDAPFAFVMREGTAYRFRPEADLWLDSTAFEQEAEAGLRLLSADPVAADLSLQAALRLYEGDYLPDALYEDWASAERERLLSLYLRAADKLAGSLIERGQYDQGIDVCQAILTRDACWERAYRLMMAAFTRQGNQPQALRAYQRCAATLRQELDVSPAPATISLYERILQAGDAPVTGV